MTKLARFLVTTLTISVLWACRGRAGETATYQEAGMDQSKLEQARDYALGGGGSGCILRGGKLVLSWGNQATRYDLKSTTKSIGVTVLGLALQDGLVDLADPARDHCANLGTPGNEGDGRLADIRPFLEPICQSVARGAPYPPSPALTSLVWAPASSVVRQATGSDTWPITWADDNDLYTAYGDGWGFEPKVKSKLSMGFAKVAGPAEGFLGVNIRSPDEQYGDGAKGKKGSGMLMVDGVLYLWVRNAVGSKGSELWWSSDHARSWTRSDWMWTEFGYPTFLNFGQNYAGAADNYVYTMTHDNPDAYEPADTFVLMRVPKDKITQKDRYEFFRHLDPNGAPVWTSDVRQRGAVFTFPGRCRRSGISYNAGTGRYLWWQMCHGTNGFGVYDAPHPWGPWTTVYFTESWDMAPGETGSFPPKWMSPDGQTIYLLFSGDDAFSVRKATLTAAKISSSARER